jgi:hypothetical protein
MIDGFEISELVLLLSTNYQVQYLVLRKRQGDEITTLDHGIQFVGLVNTRHSYRTERTKTFIETTLHKMATTSRLLPPKALCLSLLLFVVGLIQPANDPKEESVVLRLQLLSKSIVDAAGLLCGRCVEFVSLWKKTSLQREYIQ